MATVRVTQQAMTSQSVFGLQSALFRVQESQNQLSSGKRVTKPSDDPAAATDALRYRSEIRRTDQFQRNVSDAQGWLNTADNTLTSSLDAIRRIRELVLQGVNATADASSRTAITQELTNLKQQLIAAGNTTYGDKPIFAGTEADDDAFDASGVYQGNTDAIYRTIGPGGEKIQVNLDGQAVFGSGTTQLFTVIQDLIDKLNSGSDADLNAASTTSLANLDAATSKIQIALSTLGARSKRVEDMATHLLDIANTSKSQLSQAEDVDIPKTITDLQMNQMAYQAALSATSRVIQPSLVDFLS